MLANQYVERLPTIACAIDLATITIMVPFIPSSAIKSAHSTKLHPGAVGAASEIWHSDHRGRAEVPAREAGSTHLRRHRIHLQVWSEHGKLCVEVVLSWAFDTDELERFVQGLLRSKNVNKHFGKLPALDYAATWIACMPPIALKKDKPEFAGFVVIKPAGRTIV